MNVTSEGAQSVVDAWENQAYWPIGGWSAPSMGSTAHISGDFIPVGLDAIPKHLPAPLGWEWSSAEWTIDVSPSYGQPDSEGWYYAATFDRLTETIRTRTATGLASKTTSLVRRRRWIRSVVCTSPYIVRWLSRRCQALLSMRADVEKTLTEKQRIMQRLLEYEENRAFVFTQSIQLGTQGTINTLNILKDLVYKLKRLKQFLFDRLALEGEYARKLELLSRKYLLVQETSLIGSAGQARHRGGESSGSRTVPATGPNTGMLTPQKGRGSVGTISTSSPFEGAGYTQGRTPEGESGSLTTNPLMRSGGDTYSSPRHASSNPQSGAYTGGSVESGSGSAFMEVSNEEVEQDAAEADIVAENRTDAADLLFSSFNEVNSSISARLLDFSSTLSDRALADIDALADEVAVTLKDSRAVFRKNSDICRLSESAISNYAGSVRYVHNSVSAAATQEIATLSNELAALQGGEVLSLPGRYVRDFQGVLEAIKALEKQQQQQALAQQGEAGAGVAISLDATAVEEIVSSGGMVSDLLDARREDLWLSVQRYRRAVRDGQEALSVLISESIDLELYQQILSNKVYGVFVSAAKTFLQQQCAVLSDVERSVSTIMQEAVGEMEQQGPPNPILRSFFAMIQSEPEPLDSSSSTTAQAAAGGVGGGGVLMPPQPQSSKFKRRNSMEAESLSNGYRDFFNKTGVFSFTSLYTEPLPKCPAVVHSGSVYAYYASLKRDAFERGLPQDGGVTSGGSEAVWRLVYAIVTTDGYLHVILGSKHEMPAKTLLLQHCDVWMARPAAPTNAVSAAPAVSSPSSRVAGSKKLSGGVIDFNAAESSESSKNINIRSIGSGSDIGGLGGVGVEVDAHTTSDSFTDMSMEPGKEGKTHRSDSAGSTADSSDNSNNNSAKNHRGQDTGDNTDIRGISAADGVRSESPISTRSLPLPFEGITLEIKPVRPMPVQTRRLAQQQHQQNKARATEEPLFLRALSEAEVEVWYEKLRQPTLLTLSDMYIDHEIEHETAQAMMQSYPILKGETAKVHLERSKYENITKESESAKPSLSTEKETEVGIEIGTEIEAETDTVSGTKTGDNTEESTDFGNPSSSTLSTAAVSTTATADAPSAAGGSTAEDSQRIRAATGSTTGQAGLRDEFILEVLSGPANDVNVDSSDDESVGSGDGRRGRRARNSGDSSGRNETASGAAVAGAQLSAVIEESFSAERHAEDDRDADRGGAGVSPTAGGSGRWSRGRDSKSTGDKDKDKALSPRAQSMYGFGTSSYKKDGNNSWSSSKNNNNDSSSGGGKGPLPDTPGSSGPARRGLLSKDGTNVILSKSTSFYAASKPPPQIIPSNDSSLPLAKRHGAMIKQYEQGLLKGKEQSSMRVLETKDKTRNHVRELLVAGEVEDGPAQGVSPRTPSGSGAAVLGLGSASGGSESAEMDKVKRLSQRFDRKKSPLSQSPSTTTLSSGAAAVSPARSESVDLEEKDEEKENPRKSSPDSQQLG